MMTSREQFEAWLIREYSWAIDALDMAFFHGDDETGYYMGGDFIYDGSSCAEALFWAWRGWQARREAVDIKLPELFEDDRHAVTDAIRAAGIRIKGESE
ncbi:hypothetical protein [Yersinia ruckeri]|uniref:hypothetical protein n=1 Tax=Yersinia ruckeri TaxID=29486 RepID=UPI00223754CA|nr:hypothetical protein [Yersinia ruckeri]MCW6607253.1 hypothetical protein [Yersinia ruckeri]MCW6614185.1 hypothetical protein [Yersinia ruckeri]